MVAEGWQIKTIGELCNVMTGGTPSRKRSEFWGGDIPWMSSGEIHQRRITDTRETITGAGLSASNARWIPKGAVMVALNGQGKTRGTVAILDRRVTCNQSLAGILPQQTMLVSDYLFYYLSAKYTAIRRLTGDGGRNGLNLKHIRSIRIAYPSLAEQRNIASVLSSVDAVIEKTQAIIDQVRMIERGLMQELLTRGLPERHSQFMQTVIGKVPREWEIRSFNDVVKKMPVGRRYDRRTRKKYGTVPIIDQSEGGFFGYHDDGPGVRASASDPVVTFANHTCAVRWHQRSFSTIQNVFPLKGAKGIRSRFLYHLLRCAIESQGYKGHWPLLMNTMAPVPPQDEQIKICAVIDSVENRIRAECTVAASLNIVKKALMSVLLTGELYVTPDTAAVLIR